MAYDVSKGAGLFYAERETVLLQCGCNDGTEKKQAVGNQSCVVKERVRFMILFKKEHNLVHSS